ncbi:MAG TPA: sigma 54-interacting transcriptional regulator, partial [Candidatus Krumholzibacterium sp.]|nr:sigma 54-interacting transcriptional regulator [Candidatus Krumholzibacterium sp.]
MEEEFGSVDDFFAEAESDLGALEDSSKIKQLTNASKELKKTKHRLTKLEMLIDISRNLNSTLNLNELLAQIVDSVIHLADSDRGFLMLANRNNELQFRIARDRKEQPLDETDFEVSRTVINDVFFEGKTVFSNLSEDDLYKNQKSVIDLRLHTAVCVPLKLEDRVIGVIYTDSSRLTNELSKDDMSIITAFASQAAIAIENARLHGELILSRENLAEENLQLKKELSAQHQFSGIIGKSKPMNDIFRTIEKVAPLDTTVLIHGETGTGKELIAKAIHHSSSRKDRSIVPINCGALPLELLESELYGHKKGSFTGATSDKAGLFETASGGTIFLDEIGDMPMPLQVKLLRTLQESEIRRVGENINRKVDVRIIAATNRDLDEDVRDGRFRQDLFYRLNVLPITIPPLRDRKDDILPLTEHFLEKFSRQMHKSEIRILPETMKLLMSYEWPGNVRELENTIERSLVLCGESSILSREFFPQLLQGNSILGELDRQQTLKQKLGVLEKQIIIEALGE